MFDGFDLPPDLGLIPIEGNDGGAIPGVVGVKALVLLDAAGNRRAMLMCDDRGRASLSFLRADGTPVMQLSSGEGMGGAMVIFCDAAGEATAAVAHQADGKLRLHARAGVVYSDATRKDGA